MFYILDVKDYIRVEPRYFGLPTDEAIMKQLNETYVNTYTKNFGYVIKVLSIGSVEDGVVVPGDGSAYYNSDFKLLVWKPELNEVVYATIVDITNFGAFMQIGPVQGIIHISQTMDDYVSLSKTGTLQGRSTKKVLSKGDECIARIVAISYKIDTPKIGLTMRQEGLGKIQWLEEEKNKKEKEAKKQSQKEKKKDKKA